MYTIRGPIKASEKLKKEAAILLEAYLNFMKTCELREEMEIDTYIRIHGSKEFIEYWDSEMERKKDLRKHGIIVN